MSVPVRSVASLLALLAVSCTGSIAAHADSEGRAWTDPPARGAALTPESDAAKVADTASPPAAASPATSEPRAVEANPRTADAKRSAAAPKRRAAAPKPRIAAVRPRPVLAHSGPVSVPARPVRSRIAARVRPRAPDSRPVRYGFLVPPPPPDMVYEAARVRRLRQAEADGYIVVRRSTFAMPDGRLLYGYRPYEGDDD